MIPIQNGGKPRPTSGTALITWSDTPSRRAAAMVASGTEISTEKSAPRPISQSVTGSRSSTSRPAGTS